MGAVDLDVVKRKFEKEIDSFNTAKSVTLDRGCQLVGVAFPTVRLQVVKNLPLAGRPLPVVLASVEANYSDFNLLPPSVRFVDPVLGSDSQPMFPILQRQVDGSDRSLVVDDHPTYRRPFLCHPGTQEYHTHPQHESDEWENYRPNHHVGGLLWLAELLWSCTSGRVTQLAIDLGLRLEVA